MFPSLSQDNGAYTWLGDVIPPRQLSLHDSGFVQRSNRPYVFIGEFSLAMRFPFMEKLAKNINCMAHIPRLRDVLKIADVIVGAVAVNVVYLNSVRARSNKSLHDKPMNKQVISLFGFMKGNTLIDKLTTTRQAAVKVRQTENSFVAAPLVIQALNSAMIRHMVAIFKANNRTPDFVRHFDPHFAKDSHDGTRQFAVSNKGSGATLVA